MCCTYFASVSNIFPLDFVIVYLNRILWIYYKCFPNCRGSRISYEITKLSIHDDICHYTILGPFVFIGPKTLNHFAFQSFDFEVADECYSRTTLHYVKIHEFTFSRKYNFPQTTKIGILKLKWIPKYPEGTTNLIRNNKYLINHRFKVKCQEILPVPFLSTLPWKRILLLKNKICLIIKNFNIKDKEMALNFLSYISHQSSMISNNTKQRLYSFLYIKI